MTHDQFRQIAWVGAILSCLSAITTAILMYGPDAATPNGFAAAQELHANVLHTYKKWVLFFHPQFAFLAACAAAVVLVRRAPALTLVGLFYLGVWTVTEMTQQAFLIDTLNQMWRPAYLAADTADKDQWRTLITGLQGISDGQYFVLIFGFGLGTLLMGGAFLAGPTTDKILGGSMAAIGVMSLLAFAFYYAGLSSAGGLVRGWYDLIYGPLQIGARLGIAAWLIHQAHVSPKQI